MFKYNLGDRFRDNITGYEGIAVTRSQWLNGCIRYELQSCKLKDGVPVDSLWVDQAQLSLVKAVEPTEEKTDPDSPKEGPRENPQRAQDPI